MRASARGLGTAPALVVGRVQPGTAAHRAGLEAGDVITGVHGASATSALGLLAAVDQRIAGDLRLRVLRDGQAVDVAMGSLR
jgi:serine protease Do